MLSAHRSIRDSAKATVPPIRQRDQHCEALRTCGSAAASRGRPRPVGAATRRGRPPGCAARCRASGPPRRPRPPVDGLHDRRHSGPIQPIHAGLPGIRLGRIAGWRPAARRSSQRDQACASPSRESRARSSAQCRRSASAGVRPPRTGAADADRGRSARSAHPTRPGRSGRPPRPAPAPRIGHHPFGPRAADDDHVVAGSYPALVQRQRRGANAVPQLGVGQADPSALVLPAQRFPVGQPAHGRLQRPHHAPMPIGLWHRKRIAGVDRERVGRPGAARPGVRRSRGLCVAGDAEERPPEAGSHDQLGERQAASQRHDQDDDELGPEAHATTARPRRPPPPRPDGAARRTAGSARFARGSHAGCERSQRTPIHRQPPTRRHRRAVRSVM